MAWDPDQYLRYADHRARPGLELMARIPDLDARRVVDLGSGTGNLTTHLVQRWPQAEVTGIDASAEMVARATADHPRLTWTRADINQWEPDQPLDVVYSNAVLHWLGDHPQLIPRLRSFLRPGGALAIQMPDNWSAPYYLIPAEILDDGTWPPAAVDALLRHPVASPHEYRRWLQPGTIDLWRTTYYQPLTGPDPVWEWITGSMLGPVLAALEPDDRDRLADRCRPRYREAYPPDPEGVTILPFSRLFMVVMAD